MMATHRAKGFCSWFCCVSPYKGRSFLFYAANSRKLKKHKTQKNKRKKIKNINKNEINLFSNMLRSITAI